MTDYSAPGDKTGAGVSPVYAAAYDSIRKGAPGLSDATCAAIARSISMKVHMKIILISATDQTSTEDVA